MREQSKCCRMPNSNPILRSKSMLASESLIDRRSAGGSWGGGGGRIENLQVGWCHIKSSGSHLVTGGQRRGYAFEELKEEHMHTDKSTTTWTNCDSPQPTPYTVSTTIFMFIEM